MKGHIHQDLKSQVCMYLKTIWIYEMQKKEIKKISTSMRQDRKRDEICKGRTKVALFIPWKIQENLPTIKSSAGARIKIKKIRSITFPMYHVTD